MTNLPLEQAAALLRQGQLPSTSALMAQALRIIAPGAIPPLHHNDANVQFAVALGLFALDRYEEAEPYFARAAQLDKGCAEARFILGNQCFDAGDFGGAARHYAAYAKLHPQDAQAWINLGLSWMNGGAWQNARSALEKAVVLAPMQPKPAAMLATTLKQANAAPQELIAALQRATVLNANRADLHLDLARSLIGVDRFGEAKAALRRVLELDPNNTTAAWLDLQYPDDMVMPTQAAREQFLSRWRSGIERFLAIDWREPRYVMQADATIAAATNFYLAYLGLPLVEEQRRNAQVLRRLAFAAAQDATETATRTIGSVRRKVAIFSPSLNSHAVGKVWAGALLALDPAEFELGIFHPSPSVDASAERFHMRAARFESDMRSVNEWIDALRAFSPDVLVFLDVGMHQFVQAVASLRLAPVQVATWGHPVTTGMATIDYFLSADACEPTDADRHYTEHLVRLPRLGTWLELPEPAPPRIASAQDSETIRFLCVQSADKLHPGHDMLFARVLAATPGATLDLLCNKPAHVAQTLSMRMRGAFAQAGVDFDARCRVHASMTFDEYRGFLTRAHVCLDSLDFSGGITSLDCLWHELPIVTLPGALMRGRQTFGMLTLLGLPELIAQDADDYVRIATRLAQDASWRVSLIKRIALRKATLYRDQSVVDALAQFLRTVQPLEARVTQQPQTEAARSSPSSAHNVPAPLDHADGETAYRHALSLGRAGQWQAAGETMAIAWRAAPAMLRAAQGMLECAHHLAFKGTHTPASRVVDGAPAVGLISVIVCSIRPERLARLQQDLQKHLAGEDWELIHIPDAHSLCEGYTRGMRRARGDLLVFCHDDIGIVCDDFAGRLRRYLARFDVVGVAGSDKLTGPMWAWAGRPHALAWVCPMNANGKLRAFLLSIGPMLEKAEALDGVFFAARRDAAERIGFDADTFDGFHFYDLDFSYRAARAGLSCVVAADIVLWHSSGGDFNSPAWRHYAQRFVQKFPELEPGAKPAPYPSVAIEVDPRLSPAMYNWITRWALTTAPGGAMR